ncbi:MAG TPA: HEPN domain-containing protein [Candidatus Angelobacter sp.]|nr:HEPN domain-containing protein [Candidatus Angelobacter sp.]
MADKYANNAETWLIWAENAYAGACELFHPQKPHLWFSAAILGHQALELSLKAALTRKGHTVVKGDVWGHDLTELAELLASKTIGFPPEVVANVGIFSDLFDELRYPQKLEKVGGLGEEEGEVLTALIEMLRPYAKGEK